MTYEWVWDGGRPCLDFINTRRDRYASGHEMLAEPSHLHDWLRRAGLVEPDTPVTPSELDDARDLREQLDRVLGTGGSPSPADIDAVNTWARRAPIPQLTPDGGVTPSHVGVEAALGVIAADAIDLLAGHTRPTLRVCASDTCGLRFLDRSPARNRQWCSMSRCGNREKARKHYGRKKT
ncbi:CGNR zinc finger domain-containing protein [Stackebrandtia nassauensis]|uniref:Zinc finger CGNR domain-containing protein n=1 Tax=Stackebrandtia nassauensis (strain DSM 44728 / CIP 108903 / NRRL B-16338 / NBRC 102104 / LLR-40K-21) TaxID=446470 RepID=D3Q3R5_STANL|nr:CGNR zinc finger domain-containing protein [Stackebrandtia nassauensis]ADD43982.1 protein of unknown function DUF1470 [Stackebrandtia nassauensis DSM 44728]